MAKNGKNWRQKRECWRQFRHIPGRISNWRQLLICRQLLIWRQLLPPVRAYIVVCSKPCGHVSCGLFKERALRLVETIEELALSQEGAPNTHLSQREITKFTSIPKSTVQRVIKQDLKIWKLHKTYGETKLGQNPSVKHFFTRLPRPKSDILKLIVRPILCKISRRSW